MKQEALADEALGRDIRPGSPTAWPRVVARAEPDLSAAIDLLLQQVDEGNQRFALTEFIRERIAMAPRKPVFRDETPAELGQIATAFITEIYGRMTEENEEVWHARLGLALQAMAFYMTHEVVKPSPKQEAKRRRAAPAPPPPPQEED